MLVAYGRYLIPKHEENRQDRKDEFRNISQGSSTIREFTDRVLAERDVLMYLRLIKDDSEVRRVICKGLINREAKQFALLSDHISFDAFIEKVNRYDHILDSDSTKVPTALLTERIPSRLAQLDKRQCWHCNEVGHLMAYCPDILIPQE